MSEDWFILSSDPKSIAKEREKARKLKHSQWWRTKLNQGICSYCQKQFLPNELTMDHIVPIARGGKSTAGNIVPACKQCNTDKKLQTPAELLLNSLANDSINKK